MASLTLRGIRKTLGRNSILRGIDLNVKDGSFAVLVGPSGCGKSTLLRTVAGLEDPDQGTIQIGDQDVTVLAPRDRDIAMVFQSYALYPHLTVRENLAFGLRLRGESESLIDARITEVSQMLGLTHLLTRLPKEMSGGQRQRVAMGRAIARRAKIFLFDEPLSNLDAALRAEVRVEIKKLHQRLGSTMLYVTHDQVEAMTLADQLVVLNGGMVEQQGPPLVVYEKPATKFVAGFLGSPAMNFITAKVSSDGKEILSSGLRIPKLPSDVTAITPGSEVTVGIRPHDMLMRSSDSKDSLATLSLEVEVVEAMGFEAYAHGKVGNSTFIARCDPQQGPLPKINEKVELYAKVESVYIFDTEKGKTLRSSVTQ